MTNQNKSSGPGQDGRRRTKAAPSVGLSGAASKTGGKATGTNGVTAPRDLKPLQERMRYGYRRPALLEKALTHSSYANEIHHPEQSNERLEFLGDAVLSIVVSDYLFRHHSHLPEGELTKLRASLVCEKTLHNFAIHLGLGEYIRLSRGERRCGGASRPSILADAFEAVIASVYLDGGMKAVSAYILSFIVPKIQAKKTPFQDYKTTLQEVIQQNPEERLEYVLVGETGPDHDKRFRVEVHINSNVVGVGEGRSKKDAEQAAACETLALMGF